MATRLLYIHDPMCSWCWGYRPVLDQVKGLLQHQLPIINLVGGLAPDSDVPMPEAMQQQIAGYWRRIEAEIGTEFNFDFWTKNTPRRSTYPACRAVIAARLQHAEEPMILAIQQAYYLRAMNPSDEDTLLQLADELGLDFDRFIADLESDAVEQQLQTEIAQTRRLFSATGASGFPSWVLEHDGYSYAIPLDYHNAETTLVAVADILNQ